MNNIFIKFIFKVWDSTVSLFHTIVFRLLSKSFISFAMVGTLGAFSQISMTNFLLNIFDWNLNLAIIISIIFSVNIAFILNNFFTFKNNQLIGNNLLNGILKNLFLNSILILCRFLIAIFLINYIYINITLSQILAILICFVWRYLISKKFIWKI